MPNIYTAPMGFEKKQGPRRGPTYIQRKTKIEERQDRKKKREKSRSRNRPRRPKEPVGPLHAQL